MTYNRNASTNLQSHYRCTDVACLTVVFHYKHDNRFLCPSQLLLLLLLLLFCFVFLMLLSQLNSMTIKLFKRKIISMALLIFQISTNAMKPALVTPTPTAPTHQVHMSATVPAVIREMVRSAKVK